jgi:hypothetical protein
MTTSQDQPHGNKHLKCKEKNRKIKIWNVCNFSLLLINYHHIAYLNSIVNYRYHLFIYLWYSFGKTFFTGFLFRKSIVSLCMSNHLQGLGLWCLMPLSTIFILWQSVLLVEKITDLPQVTDKLNVVSSTPHHEWDSNSQRPWWWALIA